MSGTRNQITETILAVAAELFRSRGYGGTSMQDIADGVGLSRPALYYHFKNKEELLGSLVEGVTVRTQQEAARIVATAVGDDHAKTLRAMIKAQALWILRHPQHFAVVQANDVSLPEHLRVIQDKAKRSLLNSFRAVIAAGTAAGQFRAIEPTIAALCLFGMCNATIQWFRPEGRLSQEQAAEAIADLGTAMVARTASVGSHADPAGWLAVLRDDVDHLERSLLDTQGRR